MNRIRASALAGAVFAGVLTLPTLAVPANAAPTGPVRAEQSFDPSSMLVVIPTDRAVSITITITITMPPPTASNPNPAPVITATPVPTTPVSPGGAGASPGGPSSIPALPTATPSAPAAPGSESTQTASPTTSPSAPADTDAQTPPPPPTQTPDPAGASSGPATTAPGDGAPAATSSTSAPDDPTPTAKPDEPTDSASPAPLEATPTTSSAANDQDPPRDQPTKLSSPTTEPGPEPTSSAAPDAATPTTQPPAATPVGPDSPVDAPVAGRTPATDGQPSPPVVAGATAYERLYGSAPRDGLKWGSGFWWGGHWKPEDVAQVSSWRGSAVDAQTVYTERATWAKIANSEWVTTMTARPDQALLNIGVPLLADESKGDFSAVATHLDVFRQIARDLRKAGHGNAWVRLGWEAQLPDWAWHATAANAKDFKQAWNLAADAMLAEAPDLKMEFGVACGSGLQGDDDRLAPLTQLWPGDKAKIIGCDTYDQWNMRVTDDSSWQRFLRPSNAPGLEDLFDFARAHNAVAAIGEWGLAAESEHGSGDNPEFVRRMFDEFQRNTDVLALEANFSEGGTSIANSLIDGQMPQAAQVYVQLYSSAAKGSPAGTSKKTTAAIAAPSTTQPIAQTRAPAATASGFGPYPRLGSASVYARDISNAPLATDSAAVAANLLHQVKDNWNGTAGFNAGDYAAGYAIAGPDTPKRDVAFDDCQGKGKPDPGLFDGPGYFKDVPIPADARPATGTDKHLGVWDPQTDKLWEFWVTSKRSDGTWQACWGGRIDNLSSSDGVFPQGFGSSASGLAYALSMVTLQDAATDSISHAIPLGVIDARHGHVAPANRDDGISDDPSTPQEGMRLRLDPSVNVDSLPMNPLGKAIARAAQHYGFIVADKGGAVSIGAESGDRINAARGGGNIWADILTGQGASLDAPMAGFPWEHIQVVDTA